MLRATAEMFPSHSSLGCSARVTPDGLALHDKSNTQTISGTGAMRFDIDDIQNMEDRGTFYEVILHEMGHVIGVG